MPTMGNFGAICRRSRGSPRMPLVLFQNWHRLLSWDDTALTGSAPAFRPLRRQRAQSITDIPAAVVRDLSRQYRVRPYDRSSCTKQLIGRTRLRLAFSARSGHLRQLGALRRARRSQNGRDERSRRTARPDLPYPTDDGSALAVTASAPRRVCQPSASPLRCGARVAERPRAAAGNRRSVYAWSKDLNSGWGPAY